MSYCRWSTDDFQCDLYVYEHCGGGFTTHVAGNRVVYDKPLPPAVPFQGNVDAWFARHRAVMDAVEVASRTPVGLPHDGETFNDPTLVDLLARLIHLREAGYKFPDQVLDQVRAEIAETEAGDT